METGVVAIIKRGDKPEKFLLIKSKLLNGKYKDYYYPPGGHVDKGEKPLEALKREIREELGVEVCKAAKLTETKADTKNLNLLWYICEISSYKFTVDEEEIADIGFFSPEEIKGLDVMPMTKRVFGMLR